MGRPGLKVRLVFLLALVLALMSGGRAGAEGGMQKPDAAAWLVEADGRVLSSGGETRRLPQASLTKIMTALLALEKARHDDVVTVSRAAAAETGTRIGLKEGDKLRVVDLVAAALVASGNDAARALAEHVGGSEEKFVEMMNLRAAELKLADTHYANASGHDQEGNYSSAKDLAVLSKVAMKEPTFAALAGMAFLKVMTVDGRHFRIENKNELIGRYDGAVGVKSGTTPNAGKSLVALAGRDGHWVLLVILGAKERWFTSEALLNRAFELAAAKAK